INVYCAAGPQQLTLPNVTTTNSSPTGLFRATNTPLDWMKFSQDGTRLEPFVLGSTTATTGTGNSATTSGSPEAGIDYQTSLLGPTGMEVVSRSSLFGAQYDFSSTLTGFVQLIAGRTESNDTSNNANFSMVNTFAPLIAVDNAYLPDSVRQVMQARGLTQIALHKSSQQFDGRPEIGSTRKGKNVFTQWQYSVGFDWDFAETWNLRASWQQGESKRNSTAYNLVQVDRMFLGLDAVRDPATGQIVCRSKLRNPSLTELANATEIRGRISNVPLNPYIPAGVPGNTQPLPYPVEPKAITDCVPYNVFGSGNMSAEAIDYVGTDRFNIGYVDQDFSEVLVTGEVHEGWGAGPVSVAGGVTWRDQQFITYATPLDVDLLGPALNVPSLGIRGIGSGFSTSTALNLFSGIPKIGGQADVWEWFSEVFVPVWEFSGGQRIDTDFAFRRSTYDRSGAIDSWKIGVNMQVHEDLRLRLTKSRDVREPTFAELFDAQGSGETITDPVPGNGTYLINTIRGGNPELRPEYADTRTIGFVYQPTFAQWVDGLQLSVDLYEVDMEDAVSRLSAVRIINECFTTQSPELCALVKRDTPTGPVTQVLDVFLNVAAAKTRGVDVEMSWRKEIDLFSSSLDENFTIRWLTGRTFERSDTAPNSTPVDRAGSLGMPDLTTNLTAIYGIGPWSFQVQAQFVDAVKRNFLWLEGIQVDDNHVASMTWFNGRVGYAGELASGSTWNVGFNVQNILDREPPIFGWTNNTYDQYGRRYNLNFNFSY
ncbi:MAG: TonB-dependent receptor, partial [Pseudomonadota bacterium]